MTWSSFENSSAIFSIFSLELTPSLKSISNKSLLIRAFLIAISTFKEVGSKSLCCVFLSKNFSPLAL